MVFSHSLGTPLRPLTSPFPYADESPSQSLSVLPSETDEEDTSAQSPPKRTREDEEPPGIDWKRIKIPQTSSFPAGPLNPLFPFRIFLSEVKEVPKVGSIAFNTLRSICKMSPTPGTSHPIRYVVNIPFLVKDSKKDFERLQQLIVLFKQQAFKGAVDPKKELSERLALVIGFNSPRFLLEEQNRGGYELMDHENALQQRISYPCATALLSFMWEPYWEQAAWDQDKQEFDFKHVPFETVARYVSEKMKTVSPEEKALLISLIASEERKINREMVPFGEIRDTIKGDATTIDFIRTFQKKEAVVYQSNIDADILKLNGLYHKYDEFLKGIPNQEALPDLLCGGFRISSAQDMLLHLEWDLAVKIHMTIAKVFSRGFYYTETNTLLKVPEGQTLIPESFGSGDNEMKQLIDHMTSTRGLYLKDSGARFVPQTTVTTTIPERMVRHYSAYVYDGKLRNWGPQLVRTMRTVIQIINPLNWAKSVYSGLPPATKQGFLVTGPNFINSINSALANFFKAYDPISCANVHLTQKKDSTFYKDLKFYLAEKERIEKTREVVINALNELCPYYDEETLQKINKVAKECGNVIAEFILERFDLENPEKDYFSEYGFNQMGEWVKKLSKAQLRLLLEYRTLSEREWVSKHVELVAKQDGHCPKSITADDFLSRLHVALFRKDRETVSLLIEEAPLLANVVYREEVSPTAIALRNRDYHSLVLLLKAGVSLEQAKRYYQSCLNHSKRKNGHSEDSKNIESILKFVIAFLNHDISAFPKELFVKPLSELDGLSPLHIAILFKCTPIVELYCKTDPKIVLEPQFLLDYILPLCESMPDSYEKMTYFFYDSFAKIKDGRILHLILSLGTPAQITAYIEHLCSTDQKLPESFEEAFVTLHRVNFAELHNKLKKPLFMYLQNRPFHPWNNLVQAATRLSTLYAREDPTLIALSLGQLNFLEFQLAILKKGEDASKKLHELTKNGMPLKNYPKLCQIAISKNLFHIFALLTEFACLYANESEQTQLNNLYLSASQKFGQREEFKELSQRLFNRALQNQNLEEAKVFYVHLSHPQVGPYLALLAQRGSSKEVTTFICHLCPELKEDDSFRQCVDKMKGCLFAQRLQEHALQCMQNLLERKAKEINPLIRGAVWSIFETCEQRKAGEKSLYLALRLGEIPLVEDFLSIIRNTYGIFLQGTFLREAAYRFMQVAYDFRFSVLDLARRTLELNNMGVFLYLMEYLLPLSLQEQEDFFKSKIVDQALQVFKQEPDFQEELIRLFEKAIDCCDYLLARNLFPYLGPVTKKRIGRWIKSSNADFLKELLETSEIAQKYLRELLQAALAQKNLSEIHLLLKLVQAPLSHLQVKNLLTNAKEAVPLMGEVLNPLESYRAIFQGLFDEAIEEKNEGLSLLIYRFFSVTVGFHHIASISRSGPLWNDLFPSGSEEKRLNFAYFRMGVELEKTFIRDNF